MEKGWINNGVRMDQGGTSNDGLRMEYGWIKEGVRME